MAAGLVILPITPPGGGTPTQGYLSWDTGVATAGVEQLLPICLDFPPPPNQGSLVWTPSASPGLATHGTVKATGAGNLAAMKLANRSNQVLWLWLFSGSVGGTIIDQFQMPAGGTAIYGDDWFGHNGLILPAANFWGVSTVASPTTYAEYGTPANVDVSFRFV